MYQKKLIALTTLFVCATSINVQAETLTLEDIPGDGGVYQYEEILEEPAGNEEYRQDPSSEIHVGGYDIQVIELEQPFQAE